MQSNIATKQHAKIANDWMRRVDHEDYNGLSSNEATSIAALVSYAAHISGRTEFGIERLVADRFSVPSILCLRSEDYNDAVHMLMEITQ